MSYRTLQPEEAKPLVEEGWTYLDVRTAEEFAGGHPVDAFNVPVAFADPAAGGMVPNEQFVDVVRRRFESGSKLVVGCAAGGRSRMACEALAAAGFTELVNMHRGYSGARDQSGGVEPGWQALGYPTQDAPTAGRSYDELRAED